MATIILAGHETTSNTTTWLFYELSRHLEHQERILKELDTVKKRKLDAGEDEALTAHDYDSMPFLNACIKVFDDKQFLTRIRSRSQHQFIGSFAVVSNRSPPRSLF